MIRPVQIRCPLTLKPLDEIPQLSDEHIFHEAIGGPKWYSVKADANENSRLGSSADSRFLNCDLVRLWRIQHGILGKSEKELGVKLKGKIKGSDQKVEVNFKQNSVEVDYVPRVTRNPERGRTTGQQGEETFETSGRSLSERIARCTAKKSFPTDIVSSNKL